MNDVLHKFVCPVALGLLVMACGSESATTTGESPATETPTQPQTDPTTEPEAEPPVPDYQGDPEDDASFLFDSTEILTFELDVDPANMEFLNSDPVAEEYVPATLRYQGEEFAEVGLRYKGSIGSFVGCTEVFGFPPSGAKTCAKLSMKVKINHTDNGLRFHGLKKLQFHAMNSDDTQMREMLSYYLFRAMGIPAPRTVPMRLLINGEMAGVFLLVEQIDGRFTRSRFGDGGKGNLYKEVWPMHSNDARYLQALETNEDDGPSVDKIQRFRQALDNATSTEELVAVSDSWVDRGYIMNFLAVDRSIVNDDGSMHWYCSGYGVGVESCNPHNFFWYEDTKTDRMWLVPWDTDLTFHESHVTSIPSVWNEDDPECLSSFASLGTYIAPNCDPLISAWASLKDDYAQALRTFLDGPFSAGNVATLLDGWQAQMAAAVEEAHSTNSEHISYDSWNGAIEGFKIDTYRRRSAVEELAAP